MLLFVHQNLGGTSGIFESKWLGMSELDALVGMWRGLLYIGIDRGRPFTRPKHTCQNFNIQLKTESNMNQTII